jgi:hypothetical protein
MKSSIIYALHAINKRRRFFRRKINFDSFIAIRIVMNLIKILSFFLISKLYIIIKIYRFFFSLIFNRDKSLYRNLTLSFDTKPSGNHRSENNNNYSQTNKYNNFFLKRKNLIFSFVLNFQ